MNKETIEQTLNAFAQEYWGNNTKLVKVIRKGVGELFECDPDKLTLKMGGFLVPKPREEGFSKFYEFHEIKFMLAMLLEDCNDREN